MKRKISVVTVTYNCRSVIEDTINSVLMQDYSNKEYVIIDGSSTDGTLEIIKKMALGKCIFVSEKDKGIFDAMNKSLDYVTGDYVIFMNAGDRFVNNHVLSDVFREYNGDDDLIYGDTYVLTKYGYRLKKANPIYCKETQTPRDFVFLGQGICHQSLFTRTTTLRKERFNLDYPLGADYDTTARVYKNGNHHLKYCEVPVAVFDDREGGVSHYKEVQVFKERIKMFGYRPTVIDNCIIYYKMLLSRTKCLAEGLFPFFVGKYRKCKYSKKLQCL